MAISCRAWRTSSAHNSQAIKVYKVSSPNLRSGKRRLWHVREALPPRSGALPRPQFYALGRVSLRQGG
jgi:hypothetical protein